MYLTQTRPPRLSERVGVQQFFNDLRLAMAGRGRKARKEKQMHFFQVSSFKFPVSSFQHQVSTRLSPK
jgi:hypothetical protein